MFRKIAVIAVLTLAVAICAAAEGPDAGSPAAKRPHISRQDRDRARQDFLNGAKALENRQPRKAMEAFARASALDPGNRSYSVSEQIAREHLVMALIQDSEKQRILGHFDAARHSLEQAMQVDPGNPMVKEHEYELTSTTLTGKPAIRISDALASPVVLQPLPGRRTFHLRTTERQLITQVLTAYGLRPTLDDSVGSRTVRYDLDDVDFQQAKQALELATNTFLVPLDPTRVLVAKDTRTNRTKLERVATETIYLPGLSDEEMTDMASLAKNIFGIQKAQVAASHSTLTARAPVAELTALNRTLTNLLDSHGEVQLDVTMYEVSRTKATDIGLILPNQTTLFNVYSEANSILSSNSSAVQEIISSGLAAPGDWEAILGILIASGDVTNSILTQPMAYFGGGLTMTGVTTNGISENMKLNSTNVHAVDQVQLRVLDREEATIRSGERYPIETSSYSSLSSGSLSVAGISSAGLSSTLQNLGVSLSSLESAATEAVPQIQYQNIGLRMTVTPHIQAKGGVSLKLDFKLSALAGSSLNGLPILNSREYQAITTLGSGQSAVLVSTLTRSESNAVTGVPGLSEIPGFADTTDKNSSVDYSRLAIVITPHIVRDPGKAAPGMMMLPRNPQP
jgi:Flp pilus assembly secretin CpaC